MTAADIPDDERWMTDNQIVDLLSVVTAFDNRNAGRATVLAWAEVAEISRWTYAEAEQAVHQHFAESTEYLMPAHITQRIRVAQQAARKALGDEARKALPAASPASEETRAAAMAAAAELSKRVPGVRGAFAMPWTSRGRARSAEQRAEAERALEAVRPQLDRLIEREP